MFKATTRTMAVAVCALGCLLAASSASAAPVWLAPADLSAVNELAGDPTVAVDADGDLVAVWEQTGVGHGYQVEASVRPAGGGWQAPVTLSEAGDESYLPVVAVDPQGDATVVWGDGFGEVYAAVRPASGGWSAPVALDDEDQDTAAHEDYPYVVVDDHGDATAVWTYDDNYHDSVLAAERPAGGAWETPVTLDSGEYAVANPRLAVDPQGDVTAVWTSRSLMNANDIVRSAMRPAAGAWQTPVDLSDASENAVGPQVAVDPHGNATAVWDLFGASSNVVQAAVRPGAGSWQTPVELSAGPKTPYPAQQQVTVDSHGAATAVWNLYDGTAYITQAAARPAGGSWQTPVDLATGGHLGAGYRGSTPQVAVDPHGDVTAVWDLYDGSSFITQAAARPAGGSWQTPVDVSAGDVFTQAPQLTDDPQGNVTAVWQFSDGSNDVVQADGYDAAGPQLRGFSIPASGTVGIPVLFSVSPVDVWSPVASTSWSFGDGQRATDETVTHTYDHPGTYTVRVSSSDTLANATSTTANVTITPAAPVLTDVSQTHRRWREGAKQATLARKRTHERAPVGTSFSFTVNETVRVSFAFTQTVSGREVSGKCQRSTRHNHQHPRCKRTMTRATLAYTTNAGAQQLTLQGQIKNRHLPLGAFTLKLTAIDATTRQRSHTDTLHFTIVK